MNRKKLGIYCLTIILLFQTTITSITNIKVIDYIDEVLIVMLFVYSIIQIVKEKKINKDSLILGILVIIFSIIGILSCYINSDFVFERVILSNFLAIKFFIIIFALMNIKINEDIKKYFIDALLFCSKIVILFAVINFIFPKFYANIFPFANLEYRFGIPTVRSLFEHPGKYGWFMLFIATYHYAKYISTNNKNELYKFMICAGFALLSIRTKVVISLVAVVFLANIYFRKEEKSRSKKILIVILLLLIMMLCFKDLLLNTYKLYFTNEKGVSARQALFQNSLNIMQDYFPLGVGFGQYASWYARLYYSDYYYMYDMNGIYGLRPSRTNFATDTFWPAIFGETGIIGSSIYILIIILIISLLIKKIKENKGDIFPIFAILTLLQTLCESMGEPSFNSPPQNVFVALIIGIALSIVTKKKSNEEQTKKNILIIVPTLSGGGAERVATNLASNLQEYYNVRIVVFDAQKNVYDHDVEIIDLKTRSSKNIVKKVWNHIVRIIKLTRIKKDYEIDCSISFLTTPNLVNIFSKQDERVIVSIRNKMSANNKTVLKRMLVKISTNSADSVVVLSKMVQKDQTNEFNTKEEKIQVIYNACDVEKILNKSKEEIEDDIEEIFKKYKVIITAGRLTYQKGQWHLIRAFKKVVQEIPDAKLIILGTGELEEYLKTLVKNLNLEKSVFLLGFKGNPYKYMVKSDIFVFTSMFEGLGNILLEAMACGLPIISTDCDAGPREIIAPESNLESKAINIENEEYGILVPVCDGTYYNSEDEMTKEEELIARSIIDLLDNEKKKMMYKDKSQLRIKDFDKKENTKQWVDLIENICDN